jgi:serine/threonine-protein kinase
MMRPRQPDPIAVPPPQDAGRQSGRWVLPTVIAVAAVLVLGLIGVVIGLLANSGQNASPSGTYSEVVGVAEPDVNGDAANCDRPR